MPESSKGMDVRVCQSKMNEIPMASLAATVREPCPFQIPDPLPNLRRQAVVSRPAPLWGHIVEIGAPPAGCAGTRAVIGGMAT